MDFGTLRQLLFLITIDLSKLQYLKIDNLTKNKQIRSRTVSVTPLCKLFLKNVIIINYFNIFYYPISFEVSKNLALHCSIKCPCNYNLNKLLLCCHLSSTSTVVNIGITLNYVSYKVFGKDGFWSRFLRICSGWA